MSDSLLTCGVLFPLSTKRKGEYEFFEALFTTEVFGLWESSFQEAKTFFSLQLERIEIFSRLNLVNSYSIRISLSRAIILPRARRFGVGQSSRLSIDESSSLTTRSFYKGMAGLNSS